MRKHGLINDVARRSGSTRANTKAVIEACIEIMGSVLAQGERVVYSGMGVFSIYKSKKRIRTHPLTGEKFISKADRKVKFRPAKSFKSASCE